MTSVLQSTNSNRVCADHILRNSRNLYDAALKRYSAYIRSCHTSIVSGLKAAPHGGLLSEFFSTAKLHRASLVFLASSMVEGNPQNVLKAAEAIELLHAASLIHDDIIDKARTRRSVQAIHEQVGVDQALVLGDLLLLRSQMVLQDSGSIHTDSCILKALKMLSSCGQLCCCGELKELDASGLHITEQTYIEIAIKKTGSLFGAATGLGAIFGRGNENQIGALYEYGINLGIAYQLYDDWLDLAGDTELIGKPTGLSIAQSRPLLYLIYLNDRDEDCKRFLQLQAGHKPTDMAAIVEMLSRNGVLDQVRETQNRFISAAKRSLEAFRCSEERDALRQLVESISIP